MKQKVKMIDDLKACLKLIKRDLVVPGRLDTAPVYKGIDLRPREFFGLFLICAVGNHLTPDQKWSIAIDPDGGDGIIGCREGTRQGESFALEQVYVPSRAKGDLTNLVLKAINNKINKGVEYGKDRHLVVFCNRVGLLDHQRIKNKLLDNNIFHSYWVIGRYSPTKWEYAVFAVKTTSDPVAAYKISFINSFTDWTVENLGRL